MTCSTKVAPRPPYSLGHVSPAHPAFSRRARFARLALPGLPDPRPTALKRLAWEIVRRTSVQTASDPIDLRLPDPNLRGSALEVRLADFNVAKLHDDEVSFGVTRLRSVPGTLFFCVPGFTRLLQQEDNDLPRFYTAARELAQLPRAERHARLCGAPGAAAE